LKSLGKIFLTQFLFAHSYNDPLRSAFIHAKSLPFIIRPGCAFSVLKSIEESGLFFVENRPFKTVFRILFLK